MINPLVFAQAQKMSWVARLLDDNYESAWKVIELKTLSNFCEDHLALFRANAQMVKNCQVIESIKTWYLYRQSMVNEFGYSQYRIQEFIWWNRNVRLKHIGLISVIQYDMQKVFILFRNYMMVLVMPNYLRIWLLNLIFHRVLKRVYK